MKRLTATTALLLLFSIVIFAGGCSDDDEITGSDGNVANTDFTVEEDFSLATEVVAQNIIGLEGVNGTVTISGVSGLDSVTVEGTMLVGSESTADAQAYLDSLDVSMVVSGNSIMVQTIQPDDSEGRLFQVDYVIRIPAAMAVLVNNVNGNVSISNLLSQATVNVVNGQIGLSNLQSELTLNVANGTIEGNLIVPSTDNIVMSIVNGSIDIEIPTSTSAIFDADVVTGTITVTNLTLTNEVSSPTSVSGTLGAGAGSIDLSVTIGNIVVTGT